MWLNVQLTSQARNRGSLELVSFQVLSIARVGHEELQVGRETTLGVTGHVQQLKFLRNVRNVESDDLKQTAMSTVRILKAICQPLQEDTWFGFWIGKMQNIQQLLHGHFLATDDQWMRGRYFHWWFAANYKNNTERRPQKKKRFFCVWLGLCNGLLEKLWLEHSSCLCNHIIGTSIAMGFQKNNMGERHCRFVSVWTHTRLILAKPRCCPAWLNQELSPWRKNKQWDIIPIVPPHQLWFVVDSSCFSVPMHNLHIVREVLAWTKDESRGYRAREIQHQMRRTERRVVT